MIRPPIDMQFSSLTSVSPSFTSHSSNNLADIAARVVQEFRNENRHFNDDDDIYHFDDGDDPDHVYLRVENEPEDNNYTETSKQSEENPNEDQEFEFAVVCTDHNSSTASPDLIFFNGEILPRYPLFDRSLLPNDVIDQIDSNSKPDKISPHRVRQPLRKLFNEERETTSCSSSEADDLDGVSPETYCIWKPKVNSVQNNTKSNSTGSSSKRWKFRNLTHRSNSDISETAAGKNAPVIVFRPLTSMRKRSEKVKKVEKTEKVVGADDDDDGEPVVAKEGDRIRSYLPYKADQVGVFANVNGLSRNLHPF